MYHAFECSRSGHSKQSFLTVETNKAIKAPALGYCVCELLLPSPHLSIHCNKPISNEKNSNAVLESFICNAVFPP